VTSPSRSAGDGRARLRGALGPVLVGIAALAAVLVVGWAGAGATARGTRVLGVLDPAFTLVERAGAAALTGSVTNARGVALAVTALSLAVAVLSLAVGRRRAWPAVLLAAAVSLAAWAQASFVVGMPRTGWTLYGAAVLAAAVLGAARPMSRLPGFPKLPAPGKEGPGEAAPPAAPVRAAELAGVLGLVLFGLLVRAWALLELPDQFDPEMIGVMAAGRTWLGFKDYVVTELLGTGNGIFHVLSHRVLFALFGTSIYAVRLTALVWGVLAIPLAYGLGRRLGGIAAAVAAGLLVATAPEQLFWSRNENAFFAPVAALALVTAHATLSMVRRFSVPATLCAALVMPVSRFVYTPAFIMFSLPPIAFAHALVLVKGAWRRAHVALPLLLFGFGLWVFSLSAAVSWVKGERIFVHPAKVRGVEAWKHDVPAGAGPLEIARVQAERIARNTEAVVRGFVVHADYTTHWCQRWFAVPELNTTIPMGVAAAVALAVGWLLGQLRDRRAALLLAWIAVGLLPGTMSDEPEARRIALVFPAFSVAVGLFLAGVSRTVRDSTVAADVPGNGPRGRLPSQVAGLLAFAAAAALAALGLASHLLLPKGPLREEEQIRFAAPLYASADTVLHNLFYRSGRVVNFGNLDRLLDPTRPVCSRYLEAQDALEAALRPSCDFRDVVYRQLLSPAEIGARRAAHRPRRVGFLVAETPQGKRQLEMLRALFPSVPLRRQPFPGGEALATMEVGADAFEALRTPLAAADGTVTGGVYVPEPGWYRFALDPPCEGAELSVNGAREPAAEGRPLFAGVHPFEVRVRAPEACPTGWKIVLVRHGTADAATALLLAPRVAGAPGAAGRRAPAFPGYGPAAVFAKFDGSPVDAGLDARGRLHVLLWTNSAWQLVRLSPSGSVERALAPDLPKSPVWGWINVFADGSVLAACEKEIRIYAPEGAVAASWRTPYDQAATDSALLPDGRIAFVFRDRSAVEIFGRDGRRLGAFTHFEGGRGRLVSPVGIAAAPGGTLLVTEETGQALLFSPVGADAAPTCLREFTVDFAEDIRSGELRGAAFDGDGRILVPQRSLHFPLVYAVSGERQLAATAARDLATRGFADASRFVPAADALFVVDAEIRGLWKVER